MKNFPAAMLLLAGLTGLGLLSDHEVTSQADFWAGAGSALIGAAMCLVLYRLTKD